MKNIRFSNTEWRHFLLATLVLSFIFGFDDKSETFNIVRWGTNFIYTLLIVAFSLYMHEIIHKLVASKIGATTEFRIWSIKRLNFRGPPTFPLKLFNLKLNSLYVGPLLGLFLTIVSKGAFIFAAIHNTIINPDISKRASKKIKDLKRTELIMIAISGPMVSILLAMVFKIAGIEQAILVNAFIALYSMLPLPRFDGSYIFFSSPFSYLFYSLFIIIFFVFINQINLILTFLLALLISSIITLIILYRFNK